MAFDSYMNGGGRKRREEEEERIGADIQEGPRGGGGGGAPMLPPPPPPPSGPQVATQPGGAKGSGGATSRGDVVPENLQAYMGTTQQQPPQPTATPTPDVSTARAGGLAGLASYARGVAEQAKESSSTPTSDVSTGGRGGGILGALKNMIPQVRRAADRKSEVATEQDTPSVEELAKLDAKQKTGEEAPSAQQLTEQGVTEWSDTMKDYMSNYLQNPSRYDADTVQQAAEALKAQQDAARETGQRGLEEYYASRGLTGSSLEAREMGDYEAQLQRDYAQQLSDLQREQATTYGSDVARAGQLGLGYGGQQQQREAMLNDDAFQSRALDLQEQGMGSEQAFRQAQLEWQQGEADKNRALQEWMAQQGFDLQLLQTLGMG